MKKKIELKINCLEHKHWEKSEEVNNLREQLYQAIGEMDQIEVFIDVLKDLIKK